MNYPEGDEEGLRRRERDFYAIVTAIVGLIAVFLYIASNGGFMHGD